MTTTRIFSLAFKQRILFTRIPHTPRPLRPLLTTIHPRFYAINKSNTSAASEQDIAAARRWLSTFDAETIPKSICEVTFSRSSGPGGQNVNKINSKATLRVPFSSLSSHIPRLLHESLQDSRYYASKSDSLIIQADDSRKQAENVNACYAKLHALIADAARDLVPGETSVEQRLKVARLQQAENQQRLRGKKMHSDKKSNRRKNSGYDD